MKLINLLPIALIANGVKANVFETKQDDDRNVGPAKCTLSVRHHMWLAPELHQDDPEDYICEMSPEYDDGDVEYSILGLSDDFYDTVDFGETTIYIPRAKRGEDPDKRKTLEVLRDEHGRTGVSVVTEKRSTKKMNVPLKGKSKLLILYSIPRDHKNVAKTSEEIAYELFGLGGDAHNAWSQAKACSRNQLFFLPACSEVGDDCYNDPGIVNGVLEVPLTQNVGGVSSSTVVDYNTAAASTLLSNMGYNINDFDQLMHILPDQVSWGGAAAWAYLPGRVSAFKDVYAYRMGVAVHEFGHNMGLHHSGYGSAQYADHSCLMGNPSFGDDGPLICWNGAKSWETTWYEEDNLEIDVKAGEFFKGPLIGVSDWADENYTSGTHKVVIKIPDSSQALDYYVIFNRKEGPNGGVTFAEDEVTITTGAYKQISWQQAQLAEGEFFTKSNFSGSKSLVVKVCDINMIDNAQGPDTAFVLVYLDGDNNPDCTKGTTSPTQTASPTTTPTKSPTNAPTETPRPTTGCPNVRLELQTDQWGSDISWELINPKTNTVVWERTSYPNGVNFYEEEGCVEYQCLKFIMRDSWGDGLPDDGYFKFYYRNTLIHEDSGDYDNESASDQFGDCSDTTNQPTASPEEGPTSPTEAPTEAPTDSPVRATPAPTRTPTSEPTTSPVKPPSICVDVKLELQTDTYASDISWELINTKTNAVVWERESYPNGSKFYEEGNCIDPQCLKFVMYDSWGDGLPGNAYFKFYYDGVMVHEDSGDYDYESESDEFGACVDPTDSPTDSPTKSPTPDCDDDENMLHIEFQADSKSKSQNSYKLDKQVAKNNFEVILAVAKGDIPNSEMHETHHCVKKKKCYMVTVKDTGKDGICCDDSTAGYIKITRAGKMMDYSLFQEGKTYSYMFGEGCKV